MWVESFPSAGGSSISPRTTCDRLLDTNVLIHAVRGRPLGVRAQLQQQSPDDVAVSSITIAELWYGAEKSSSPARRREAGNRCLSRSRSSLSIETPQSSTRGFDTTCATDRSASAIS